MVELRPTIDICSAKCVGHACYKGNEKASGCPMFNHVIFTQSNQHCVMCMDCVRSCPNGSPQLNLRVPGRELWGETGSRPDIATFVVMLDSPVGSGFADG
jgi:Fe-S oxidoreductase